MTSPSLTGITGETNEIYRPYIPVWPNRLLGWETIRHKEVTLVPLTTGIRQMQMDELRSAAERILLGQYRMTTQGTDAEKAAKDRYEIAQAYIQLSDAVRFAIDHAGGRECEWGDRAIKCFETLEKAIAVKPNTEHKTDMNQATSNPAHHRCSLVKRFRLKPREIVAIKMPDSAEYPFPSGVAEFLDSIGRPWEVLEIPQGYHCVKIASEKPGRYLTVDAGQWLFKDANHKPGKDSGYGHCGWASFEDYEIIENDKVIREEWEAYMDRKRRDRQERWQMREDYNWNETFDDE